MWIDEAWVSAQVAAARQEIHETDAVTRLKALVLGWAIAFAEHRTDIESPTITWPRRGLLDDEARSFLRAIDKGLAQVDDAGYVSLPTVRPKTPRVDTRCSGRVGSASRSTWST